MNTKPLPAIMALLAGALVSVLSFFEQIDVAVFARRFIIATILFFILGSVAKVVIDKNFKEPEKENNDDDEEETEDQDEDSSSDE